jgi:hypothetical protein
LAIHTAKPVAGKVVVVVVVVVEAPVAAHIRVELGQFQTMQIK